MEKMKLTASKVIKMPADEEGLVRGGRACYINSNETERLIRSVRKLAA